MEKIDLKGFLSDLELAYIQAALQFTGGNIAKAADLLGYKRTTLREKIHTKFIQEPKLHPTLLVDPEGDFSIERVNSLLAVKFQGEVVKKFRTITKANEFLREKMDE